MTTLLDLSRRYYLEDGTRKPDHYLHIYQRHMPDRDAPLKVLELGVSSGASMRVWRDYFAEAELVGFDISPLPDMIADHVKSGSITYVQGDQRNLADLDRCGGAFDVIIDDASHVGGWSRVTFDHLFAKALKPGGLYFVEDYGTGYMPDFYDGAAWQRPQWDVETRQFASHSAGMVGWMKSLVDEMHVPAIAPTLDALAIDSVQFWPSIALVTKKAQLGR